ADNNDLAVFDVSRPRESRALGFIPTGWYPTSVRTSPDGRTIYVAEGKGRKSLANPRGPVPGKREEGKPVQYIGSLLDGSLAKCAAPDGDALARYTQAVRDNTPEGDDRAAAAETRAADAAAPGAANPVPLRRGDPSPIKHVFYIIKENRTYDQVLGDM